ncbi:hypothetical protein ACOSQ3_001076 [Xanthoceras sorbifolium]
MKWGQLSAAVHVCRRNGSGSIAAEYVSWESRNSAFMCSLALAASTLDNNSPWPIPEGWKFETKTTKDGSQFSSYVCLATGEHFYTYEGMMRCVNYTRETLLLPGWIPSFDFLMDIKNNVDDRSSESALDNGEVMTLETFLEKFLGSGANNVPPEVGFSREHEHIPTGNDNVEAPALGNTGFKMQLSAKPKISKSIKKRHHRPKKN